MQGAQLRDESRGAHYKPDFPERNDEQVPEDHQGQLHRRGRAEVEFEEVDTKLINPRPRRYDATA